MPVAQPPPAPPAAGNKSAGGIWHGFSTSNETLTLFIAETGDLRVQDVMGLPPSGPLPLSGAGAVLVTGDQLAGAFDTGRPFSTFSEHCELTGTVVERVSLSITLDCTDSTGVKRSPTLILGYDTGYDGGSSLASLAGNYTFALKATNVLNIDGNGVIFGVYDNAPNCTVNGTAKIVDARYNLYAIEWRMSLCQAPFVQYEGATMSGYGTMNLRGQPPKSLLLLLTGVVAGHMESSSLLYVPP
ncbi:MAG TPA: hypothetical protein VL131_08690 [Gammaproteobacteria bacterium]|nr:hypothetical protein [Gammaproteobacteria bacterium]